MLFLLHFKMAKDVHADYKRIVSSLPKRLTNELKVTRKANFKFWIEKQDRTSKIEYSLCKATRYRAPKDTSAPYQEERL